MKKEEIARRLEENRIPFDSDLPGKLEIYLKLLLEWNQKMDLIAGTDEEETFDRHFTDSLTVLKTDLLDGAESLIDVGTGAGFPGLVIAMARPEIKVTLMDAQQKRLNFLQVVTEAAGIGNCEIVHARAEDGGKDKRFRERFDIACARAVAPMNVLSEYLLPFVKTGGKMICWKGPALDEEMESGRKAIFLLGGEIRDVIACPVAGRDWDHRLMVAGKIKKTPGIYPRKAGTPKAKPLGE